MKIQVISEFYDKFHTNTLFREGMVLDFDEARAKNIIARKLGVAYSEPQKSPIIAPKEYEPTTEPEPEPTPIVKLTPEPTPTTAPEPEPEPEPEATEEPEPTKEPEPTEEVVEEGDKVAEAAQTAETAPTEDAPTDAKEEGEKAADVEEVEKPKRGRKSTK